VEATLSRDLGHPTPRYERIDVDEE